MFCRGTQCHPRGTAAAACAKNMPQAYFLTLRPGRTYFSPCKCGIWLPQADKTWGPRANPVERFAWGEETQGSGWRFRRQAEPEQSGLCGDERAAECSLSEKVASVTFSKVKKRTAAMRQSFQKLRGKNYFSSTSVTAPEPTVRPPSRIAKRRPFSMAMGVISSTLISTLSPGMHISVPSGRVMTPVTSVVRK